VRRESSAERNKCSAAASSWSKANQEDGHGCPKTYVAEDGGARGFGVGPGRRGAGGRGGRQSAHRRFQRRGFGPNKSLLLTQNTPGIGDQLEEDAEAGDRFGAAVAVGDINTASGSDLVIGAPGEDRGNAVDAGAIHLLIGDLGFDLRDEERLVPHQDLDQDTATLDRQSQTGDEWGAALAIGQLDDDDRGAGVQSVEGEIAVGAPGEGNDRGEVDVLNFDRQDQRILDTATQTLVPGFGGVVGSADPGDRFGAAVATGDYNNDNKEDLAVGVPEELVQFGQTPVFGAGEIDVVDGSNPAIGFGGLNENRAQAVTENTPDIFGLAQLGDHFGSALADLPQ
jgi:hypothetical protein